MIVEFKVNEMAWIDKSVWDDGDYNPNFCLDEICSQMYKSMYILDKRE